MADTTQTPNRESGQREPGKSETMHQGSNQTLKHEQAKASVGGQDRSNESGSFREQDRTSGEQREKSAIGGGDKNSPTGEPGRARSELDQKQKSGESSHQR